MERKFSRRMLLVGLGSCALSASALYLAQKAHISPIHAAPQESSPPVSHTVLIKNAPTSSGRIESAGLQLVQNQNINDSLDQIGWGLYETFEPGHVKLIEDMNRNGMEASENGPVFGFSEPVSEVPFDDPYRPKQWDLDMIGINEAFGYILDAIPPEGFSRPGEKIQVAFIDTGIVDSNTNHDAPVPIAAISMIVNTDPIDTHGHGTASASAMAITGNGIGISGVCPQTICEVLNAKVLDGPPNTVPQGTWAGVAAGIVWSVDQGAQVINLSLGGVSSPQVMLDAIQYALEKKVIIVAASGNSYESPPQFPASNPGVLAVAAHTQSGALAQSSSSPDKSDQLSVAAPTTTLSLGFDEIPVIATGSSRAASYPTAIIALLLSMGATPEMALEAITKGAIDIGDEGYDRRTGYGRVSAESSVKYLIKYYDWLPPPQIFLPFVANDIRRSVYIPLLKVSEGNK